MPGTAGGQDVQDTVEQAAGVTPGSADVRLRWREVVPDDLPEIIVNFPEDHESEYYLRGLINWDNLYYYALQSSNQNLSSTHSGYAKASYKARSSPHTGVTRCKQIGHAIRSGV